MAIVDTCVEKMENSICTFITETRPGFALLSKRRRKNT
jgi:hypothetical protein